MQKIWQAGDKVDLDTYNGSIQYNTVEAYESSDIVSKFDLNRPIRNLFENEQELFNFVEYTYNFLGMKNGIVKDSLTSEFYFKGDSDVVKITINPGTGDTTMSFAKLRPGIAYNNKKLVVNKPQTHIAERQLIDIFSLDAAKDENVQINYFYTTNKYQARITKRNINGVPTNYDFGTWGDSTSGYKSGIAMLAAIYGDTLRFRDEFKNAVNVRIDRITLEPIFKVVAGDSRYWKIKSDGTIYGDSKVAQANEMLLWHFKVSANGDSVTSTISDGRTYVQHFNDFYTYAYLNTPQSWGDTDSYLITNPISNTTMNYSAITNSDAYITIFRKNGTSNNNSVLAWRETAVQGISQSRTQRFLMNKDLIVKGDTIATPGDTLGKKWASILEMSGDSWVFWGNKDFKNGYFRVTGNNTGDSSFLFSTLGGFRILASDNIDIDGDSVWIDARGNVNIVATTGKDMYLTAGDSVKITATAGDFGINSGKKFFIAATDNVFVDGDTMTITARGNVVISAAASKDLYITAGDSIKIDATGNMRLSSGAAKSFKISSGDTLRLDSTTDIRLIAGDSIELTSANTMDINANGGLDVDVTGNMDLLATGTFSIDGTGASNLSTTSGNLTISTITSGNITISAATSDISVLGDTINITAQGDLNLSGDTMLLTANNFSVAANGHIKLNNANISEIGDTADCASFIGDTLGLGAGVFVKGSFAAFKIYNAVWNDLAEGFDFSKFENPRPGYVFAQTKDGVIRTRKYAEKAVVGVYSDTAGFTLGSKDIVATPGGTGTKIPIGLAGKVRVWVDGKIKIGDLLTSYKDGYARKANFFVRVFMSDRIIGKALEDSYENNRIWMLIG